MVQGRQEPPLTVPFCFSNPCKPCVYFIAENRRGGKEGRKEGKEKAGDMGHWLEADMWAGSHKFLASKFVMGRYCHFRLNNSHQSINQSHLQCTRI